MLHIVGSDAAREVPDFKGSGQDRDGKALAAAKWQSCVEPVKKKDGENANDRSTRQDLFLSGYLGQSHPNTPAVNPAYTRPSIMVRTVVRQLRRYQMESWGSASE
jgi:hypothetical protein